MKLKLDEAYLAWRESESYQVPMTAEGEEKAQQRRLLFQKGWNAAVKTCARACEELPAPDRYSDSDKSVWGVATIDCEQAILELESK